MTDNERLAAIEARIAFHDVQVDHRKWVSLPGVADDADVRWLIAEVRRRDDEYARGRADERTSVVAWLRLIEAHEPGAIGLADCIERGERVEEVKDG